MSPTASTGRAAAEDLVAGRVRDMAATLRVREDTAVRSYLSAIDPAGLVAALQAAGQHSAWDLPHPRSWIRTMWDG